MTEKVAILVAGGSGMGAAAARRLAADGYGVAILSSSGKGEALAAALGGIGVSSNQSVDDLKRLVERTMARWGRGDVLVNGAGHGPRAPILEITDEQWLKGFDTYLMNVIRATRLVAPIMIAQKGGAIVNISTAWAFEPAPNFPTSAVARAGLAAYTRIFAETHGPDNAHEQRPAGLDRQLAGDRGAAEGDPLDAMAPPPRSPGRSPSWRPRRRLYRQNITSTAA